MGTTKRRQSKRNNSRQTALSFLSNITLGNEHEIRPISTITETMVESPTTTQQSSYQNIPNTTHTVKPTLTRYGTLSVTNDTAIKGFFFFKKKGENFFFHNSFFFGIVF